MYHAPGVLSRSMAPESPADPSPAPVSPSEAPVAPPVAPPAPPVVLPPEPRKVVEDPPAPPPEPPQEPSHAEKIAAAGAKLAQALEKRADLHGALVHIEAEVQSLEKLHRLLMQQAPTEHPPFIEGPNGRAIPNPALVKGK